jgi:hypothetical protein
LPPVVIFTDSLSPASFNAPAARFIESNVKKEYSLGNLLHKITAASKANKAIRLILCHDFEIGSGYNNKKD